MKTVKTNRRTVSISILTVSSFILILLGVAFAGYPQIALWGILALTVLVLFIRVLAPENVWFKAKNKAIDAIFLIAIIILLSITIPYATLPSPI